MTDKTCEQKLDEIFDNIAKQPRVTTILITSAKVVSPQEFDTEVLKGMKAAMKPVAKMLDKRRREDSPKPTKKKPKKKSSTYCGKSDCKKKDCENPAHQTSLD